MQPPLISIIVPVYKVEQYLHKTIGSILAQTYTNWELILVDDGSPDNSSAICDEYAVKDIRFKVFHKPNGGVSSARNKGLDNATGVWVCFLDSDDWWEPSFLQNFVDVGLDGNDVLLQSFYIENEFKCKQTPLILPEKTFLTAAELVVFLEEAKGVHNGFLWHRLFKLSIFNEHNLRFPEGVSFAEDGCVFFQYMKFASKSVMTSRIGYHYRIAQGSLTSQSKKVPEATFRFLLESYLSNLYEIIEGKKTDDRIVNSIKKYGWRLTESWIVNRSMAERKSYMESHLYCKNMITKYHLCDVKDVRFSLRILINLCNQKPSNFNYLLIKITELFRKCENKIVKHL